MCLNSQFSGICEIHSLVRYSREVLNRSTARASGVFQDEKRVRYSSAYRTPEMGTRGKGGLWVWCR